MNPSSLVVRSSAELKLLTIESCFRIVVIKWQAGVESHRGILLHGAWHAHGSQKEQGKSTTELIFGFHSVMP